MVPRSGCLKADTAEGESSKVREREPPGNISSSVHMDSISGCCELERLNIVTISNSTLVAERGLSELH